MPAFIRKEKEISSIECKLQFNKETKHTELHRPPGTGLNIPVPISDVYMAK
jgi:hypothetical protein